MTDDELLALVKRVDPQAVRLPPGIKAIAAEIEATEREACHRALETIPSVRIPSGEEEAVLMVLLGTKWLQDNAPHRLKPNAVLSVATNEVEPRRDV